jgi:hypothetical protein
MIMSKKLAPRTGADFAAKHDPQTVITHLLGELDKARADQLTAAAVRDFLGTAVLQTEALEIPEWVEKPSITSAAPGVPGLLLSDLHWGERVFKTQVNGVNEYNLEIARKRLRHVIETVPYLLKILDPQMRYPGIVVKLGGDMVGGNIHDELAATNEMNIMPTWLDLYTQLVSGLTYLANIFGNVFVPCVSGNHDRDTKKTWHKDRNATSFGWLLYQMLADKFRDDKRFTFYIPDSADALYRVYNTRMLLTHGDQFPGSDSIIGPIGSLMRGTQKKQQMKSAVDQTFDVLECGHWHQRITLSHLIVNNSLKGYDEYAYAHNFRFSRASQNLWTTHADIGINWEMEVLAEKAPKHSVTTPWASIPTT